MLLHWMLHVTINIRYGVYTRPQTDDSPLVYNFEFFTYFSAEDNTYLA